MVIETGTRTRVSALHRQNAVRRTALAPAARAHRAARELQGRPKREGGAEKVVGGITKEVGRRAGDFLGWEGHPVGVECDGVARDSGGEPPENTRPASRGIDLRAETTGGEYEPGSTTVCDVWWGKSISQAGLSNCVV